MARFSATALLALSLAVPGIGGPHLHPKFRSQEKTVRKVLILPVKAEFVKSGVRGSTPNEKLAQDLENDMTAILRKNLESKGVVVSQLDTTQTSDREVADLQALYDGVVGPLKNRSKEIDKGNMSLGDEIAKSKLLKDFDAVLFVRADATTNTKGKNFLLGGLGGMIAFSGVTVRPSISLVDSQNGEVLFHLSSKQGIVQKQMDKYMRSTFKQYPSSTQWVKK